jgi:hypothetical protein
MSMGSDHVSELQPPMGQLFIPLVIYEHGEPRWSDGERGKLPIRPPEPSVAILSAEPSSSKSGGTG